VLPNTPAKTSMSAKYLLGGQFQRLHGLSVDQALSGHWLMPRTREVMPPEAHDEMHDTLSRGRTPWQERVAQDVEQRHEPRNMLRDWAYNHTQFLVGSPMHVATKLRDFTGLMREEGTPNTAPIYRGSAVPPHEILAKTPDSPLSFSTDRYVAQSFRGRGGVITKLPPNSARGLLLSNYGAAFRTVGRGRRPESEFLADPESLKE
jgi:hypothetical protein